MMAMAVKQCVRCRQKDHTDFSTCRFCGTNYDAVLPKPKKQFSFLPLVAAVITFMCLPSIINGVGYVVTGGAQPYLYRYLWQESMIKIFVCLSNHYDTHQSEEHWRRLADDMHRGKTINEEDIKYVAARDHLSQSEARQKLQDNRDKENAGENTKGTVHK